MGRAMGKADELKLNRQGRSVNLRRRTDQAVEYAHSCLARR